MEIMPQDLIKSRSISCMRNYEAVLGLHCSA